MLYVKLGADSGQRDYYDREKTLRRKNIRLAGRSASRRMK